MKRLSENIEATFSWILFWSSSDNESNGGYKPTVQMANLVKYKKGSLH